jgi:hypothetical protein
MASLNSYMKKNQKKIMAIFSAGLMIAFALPSAVSNYSKNRDITYGYVGSAKVTNKDIAEASARWALLKRTLIFPADPDRRRQTDVPFLQGYLQERLGFDDGQTAQIVQQFEANPEAFYLLVREAEDLGTAVSNDEVEDVWNNTVHHPTADDPGDYDRRARDAIHAFLMVANASSRAGDMAKVSRPQRDQALARTQQIGLNLVEFKAKDYLPKVGQWSEQDKAKKIDAQYEAYKNFPPATQPGNDIHGNTLEFGFGYQVPNQVSVEYLEISGDAVRKLASSKVRLADAFTYLRKNRDRFARPLGVKPPPGVAATQPSTQPSPTLPKVFTDRATTRPLSDEELLKYFPIYQDEIFKQLIDDQAAALTRDIMADLNSSLSKDYTDFKNNLPAGPTTTATSLPASSLSAAAQTKFGPYPRFEYLQKLAASVNAARMPAPTTQPATTQSGDSEQLVRAVRSDGPRSAKQLADWAPIAKAMVEGFDFGRLFMAMQNNLINQALFQDLIQRARFSNYVTRMVEPLAADDDRRAARMVNMRVLSLYEPSPILRGEAESSSAAAAGSSAPRIDNLFIFRVTQAEPAHAPPKEAVIEQVTADARLVDAYNLARQDAAKLAETAHGSGAHLAATAAANGKTLITTGLIEQQQGMGGMGATLTIPNYPLPPGATQAIFMNGAYKLVLVGGAEAHPIGVIDLRPTGTVLVGEVNQVQPRWSGQTLPTDQLLVTAVLRSQLETVLRYRWFTLDDTIARMHWRGAEGAKKPTTPSPTQPPLNPF